MTSNTTEIIQYIQEKVLEMIEMVTGQAAIEMTAYDAEKEMLKELLAIGASFMSLYYKRRSAEFALDSATREDGVELPFHSWKQRQQLTIFGDVEIERSYFYESGKGGYLPMDKAVNLPPSLYSDVLQEIYAELAVEQSYKSGHDFMKRWLNLSVSTRAVQEVVTTSGTEATAFYEQMEALPVVEEATVLVAQADGKGVPLVINTETSEAVRPKRGQARSRKKEAIVTTLYSQQPYHRSGDDVLAVIFRQDAAQKEKQQRAKPACHQMIWATLAGKEVALTHLQAAVQQREHEGLCHRVALCDGAEALQKQMQEKLPDFTLILDFIHAYEYLWKAANTLFAEDDPQRLSWVKSHTRHLLSGQTQTVIDHLRQMTQSSDKSLVAVKKLHQVAGYFERNLPYMVYDRCLELGWPIASGVIEGACRHIVKDRMELSGMRWTENGAEQLLSLRCIRHNNHWDAFWRYRRLQRLQPVVSNDVASSLPLAA